MRRTRTSTERYLGRNRVLSIQRWSPRPPRRSPVSPSPRGEGEQPAPSPGRRVLALPHRLTRRALLRVGAGSAAAAAMWTRGGPIAAAQTQTVLWMLDADWGYPLSTPSGVRTRCRGRACHNAAPNRFFLTREEALAGRLHPCCLAQPVEVCAAITTEQLLPYYRARRGGIDRRCPELPEEIRVALTEATLDRCSAVPTHISEGDKGSTLSDPRSPSDVDQPFTGGRGRQRGPRRSPPAGSAISSQLPMTGGEFGPLGRVGVGLLALGGAATLRASRTAQRAPDPSSERPETTDL